VRRVRRFDAAGGGISGIVDTTRRTGESRRARTIESVGTIDSLTDFGESGGLRIFGSIVRFGAFDDVARLPGSP